MSMLVESFIASATSWPSAPMLGSFDKGMEDFTKPTFLMKSVPFNTKVPEFQTKEDEEEIRAIEEEITNDLLKLQGNLVRKRKSLKVLLKRIFGKRSGVV